MTGRVLPNGQPASTEYVVFDLEANSDRALVRDHEILEIGAVLISGHEVADRFSTLVRNERPITDAVSELTGLDQEVLGNGIPLREALTAFAKFAGARPLVAHNGHGYDYILIDAAAEQLGADAPAGDRLDSLELAHVVFPRAGTGLTRNADGTAPPAGRGLDDLAALFDLPPRSTHRALGDAELTHLILSELLGFLNENSPARRLQRYLLASAGHPWSAFLVDTGDLAPLETVVSDPSPAVASTPTGAYNIDAMAGYFQPGGSLLSGGRSHRPQQAEMAKLVAGAMSASKTQLIEAPTGTGKTLAYIVPAIEWARASGSTVIVSAHSRVLQNQILAAVEELQGILEPFSAALLKGRENYLSLDALAGELDGDPPDDSTALLLAVLCGWIHETPTGDWADLRTWAIERNHPQLRHLRAKLSVDSPPGPVTSGIDRLEFYRRALDAVENSHLAIFNHALLVSRSDWMGDATHLVVDEAHNLEDSATDALSDEVTQESLHTLCQSIWDPESRRGTARRLSEATERPLTHPEIDRLRNASLRLSGAIQLLTEPLIDYLRDRTGAQREDTMRFGTSYRIRAGSDTANPSFQPVLRASKEVRAGLGAVADALNSVTIPANLSGRYRRSRLEGEVRRLGRRARDAAELLDRTIWAEDGDDWINIAQLTVAEEEWRWGLRRVPISVSSELAELWGGLKSAVLTSATLQVSHSFSHIVDRLGLQGPEAKALSSPFPDITKNHLLLLTDYLPAPRGRLLEEFMKAEASEIPRLIMTSDGRAMVLMTARARLEFVRDHARPILEQMGLPLLGQGDEPSPALIERMQADTAASLIALRSFWEGVDVPGETLSLLVIEKIPFESPGDPVIGARMEAIEIEGRDPFADYLVPRAALRFTQGVGRLIRANDDVGCTVVLDNRLRRPLPYRDSILSSLHGPPTQVRVDDGDAAYRAIAQHLGLELDDDLLSRIQEVSSADGWAALADLALSPDEANNEDIVRARLDAVREMFGFEGWRPGQVETMVRFIRGEDVLAVLPTGSGKSITFQIPALLSPGVTLVISPLIALMRDQTQNLRARGLTTVAAIHSGVPQSEQNEILRGARAGRYKLIYVSPERLWSPMFRAALKKIDIDRIAVDEAHCISQWGHSFRPEYSAIPQALVELEAQSLPVLAATATATPAVREEIVQLMDLDRDGHRIIMSPERPELRYFVERCESFEDRDLRVLQVTTAFRREHAIVYVPKRKDTVRVAGMLQADGHVARPYHGGMPDEQRLHIEDAFRHGEVDVVVATKAFGLGIDKPDISLILHLEMPASIEEYVQETGRAARGAREGVGPEIGTCVLLQTPRDCHIHRFFIRNAAPDVDQVKALWRRLRDGTNYLPPDELDDEESGATWDRQSAGLAVHYLSGAGLIQRYNDVVWEGRVLVPRDAGELIDELRPTNSQLAEMAESIVQFVDSRGSETYNAQSWESGLGRPAADIEADLLELQYHDILGFSAWRYAWTLERMPGVDPDWSAIESEAQKRMSVVADMATQARVFAQSEPSCRKQAMLDYLGVESRNVCGACDACTDLLRPWAEGSVTREQIVDALPVRRIIVGLVHDTQHARYSERRIVRTLLGEEGKYQLPVGLRTHPSYGRLQLMGFDGVGAVISQLIDEGKLREVQLVYDGSEYAALQVV